MQESGEAALKQVAGSPGSVFHQIKDTAKADKLASDGMKKFSVPVQRSLVPTLYRIVCLM